MLTNILRSLLLGGGGVLNGQKTSLSISIYFMMWHSTEIKNFLQTFCKHNTQYSNTQHNDTQYLHSKNDAQHNDAQYYVILRYFLSYSLLSAYKHFMIIIIGKGGLIGQKTSLSISIYFMMWHSNTKNEIKNFLQTFCEHNNNQHNDTQYSNTQHNDTQHLHSTK